MPHTAERAKSIAGDYKDQIMKYIEAGIKQVYIVANLPERTREQVSRELKEEFCDKGVEIEVIAGNVNALLDFLNKLSSGIVEEAKKRMGEVLYRIVETSSSQK